MSEAPEVSLLWPVVDRAKNIAADVASWREWLSRLAVAWEFIIVDRGSRDGTQEYLRELTLDAPGVSCHLSTELRTWGEVVWEAVPRLRGRVLGVVEAAVPALPASEVLQRVEQHGRWEGMGRSRARWWQRDQLLEALAQHEGHWSLTPDSLATR